MEQIDLSNWREPNSCQWAFKNVDKILNTHKIERSKQSSLFPSKPIALDERFKLKRKDGSELDLKAVLAATDTDSVVVLKDCSIVYEHYDHGNDAQTKHIMMSLSKSICGLVAGILHGQGKLKLEAPVTEYVPEMKVSSLENATVRQCLDMRSNVHYVDGAHGYRAASGWEPLDGSEKHDNLHDFIADFHAPSAATVEGLDGAPFDYVSVNTDLMGWILERAAGEGTYSELVSNLLWQRIGTESNALMTVDKDGAARSAGGMCATVRDIARVGQLIADGGRDVVPQAWIEDILHGGSKEAFAAGSWAPLYSGLLSTVSYRSYWLSDRDTETFLALGIHGQHLFVDRKNGIVLAKTSSQPQPFDPSKYRLATEAFLEIRRLLTEEI